MEPIEVHNVWTVYGRNADGSEAEQHSQRCTGRRIGAIRSGAITASI